MGSLNLYTDKGTLSVAAFHITGLHMLGQPVLAQDCDCRNVLHSYSDVGYTELSDIEGGCILKDWEQLKFVYYL